MNTDFYKRKLLAMLNDVEYYKQIPDNGSQITLSKIRNLLKENNKLTKQENDFLVKFEWKTSLFYGLPKIHKSKIIQDAIKHSNSEYIELMDPDDLNFRPIVAGTNCETSRLSSLLDILLKPFVKYVNSNITNNIDLQ